MATLKEIIARTGLSESEAKTYMNMAEDRVRLYLAYKEDEDISQFSSVISDVAVSLYEKQNAVRVAQEKWLENAGKESTQYQEGPVSVRETYAGSSESAGASVGVAYDSIINNSLHTIARYRKVRVVTC